MIRKISFFTVLVALMASCNNSTTKQSSTSEDPSVVPTTEVAADTANKGKLEFSEKAFDFGTVKEGDVVEHTFKFTNTGKAPIILSQVSASCGCTTPNYTKDPVLPGKEGEIKVSFNSAGQVGKQQKIVTVLSNAENNVLTVQIKGTVEGNK